MEAANKIGALATRLIDNKTAINVFLGGSFLALGVRSLNQQKDIEALEAEKESLIKSNKAIREAMWNWKQQLFAEATAAADNALVPLSKLKAIYGEASTPQSGDAGKEDVKSPASRFVV
ncbi:uncharacterized protein LOC110816699 isoform X1 [Carica papaya]|uniref:uncharacterized protein LOC110816699 isoform X1 n=1 Tax=Carica papaya TaxID=3649 RepID=UPI000B8D0C1D|nr:uncharacterized protein LOC110816699 isoform X1 [Carica papaya]